MNIVIIGGGVVGLNCALEFSLKNPQYEIFVLEAEPYLGSHTSTRNSEVLHAGFAYPPNSLKSLLCIQGKKLTYELAKRLDIPCKQTGKWILAFTDKDEKALNLLMQNAKLCNVNGMEEKTPNQIYKTLPWLNNIKAGVFSKTSGLIDTSEYIHKLEIKLSQFTNCNVLTHCKVTSIDKDKKILKTTRGEIQFDLLINSAGLFADEIYTMTGGSKNYEIRPYKGEYYTWNKAPFNELIYPVSKRFYNNNAVSISSMGIHLHKSLSGDRYVGPSEIEIPVNKKTDYKIESNVNDFIKEASTYCKNPPKSEDLSPAQAGNRPKLFENGNPIGDFLIFRENDYIHLLGIESPGLTAAPAIAKKVSSLI